MSEKRQSARAKARDKAKSANTQGILMLVVGLGLILIAVAAFFAMPKAAEAVRESDGLVVPVSVNFEAPDVALTDLQGNPVALSDYAGKVILYNSWATWCPPCKAEMPTLQAYYDKYKDQGLVIIAIEDGQPLPEVADFVQQFGLTFPVWPDPEYKASKTYNVSGLPTSFVIDRDGIVRLTWSGEISMSALEKYVTPLLAD